MRLKFYGLWLMMLAFAMNTALAQTCPTNIGFEDGTFTNWTCTAGTKINGNLVLFNTGPVVGRHTIIKNTSPQAKDPYGKFPIVDPNGSGYSVMLGNSTTGAEVDKISYTYTIPANKPSYSIVFNYAVVFEDPIVDHTPDQRPAFTANVFNVTDNSVAGCGSFKFIAGADLQGFKLSDVPGKVVYYKEWSPVTIDLTGYAGKTIRLEFTANDCTTGAHFGYAYLDVIETCDSDSPITGNNYCIGAQAVNLSGPVGYQDYKWYNADHTVVLGTDRILNITPAPPHNAKYALDVTPFPGVGCFATLYTTINQADKDFVLKVQPEVSICDGTGTDLTKASVTTGSSADLKFQYYTDASRQNFVADPKNVTTAGDYYIVGTNKFGCNDIKSIRLKVVQAPQLTIVKPPAPACGTAVVDLTDPAIIGGRDPALTYSYSSDAAGTMPVTNPAAINKSGNYYIKATNAANCNTIKQVTVTIGENPVVNSVTLNACPPTNILTSSLMTNNTAGLTYTYWADADATIAIADPQTINQSITFYLKGTTAAGCSAVAKIAITIYPLADFTPVDPAPVTYPQAVDLTKTHLAVSGLTFSYWKDAAATIPLANYTNVIDGGRYYIKGENTIQCSRIKPVVVSVNEPAQANMVAANTFSPNGDGVNERFNPISSGAVTVNYLKIYGRQGQLVFETRSLDIQWDGTVKNKPAPAGTYYWVYSCYDTYRKTEVTKSGSVTIIR